LTSLKRFDLANRFEKSCNIALTGTSKTSPDYIPGESKLQHPVVNAKITALSDPRRRLEMRQDTSQKLMVAEAKRRCPLQPNGLIPLAFVTTTGKISSKNRNFNRPQGTRK